MKTLYRLCGLLALLAASGVRAEVLDSQPNGFTTRATLAIAAPPAKVWAGLIQPNLWWSSQHTFSHDARNLSLEPSVGGAWRETLPDGGGLRHMTIVDLEPSKRLRLEGALGPLQALGVAAHLTFTLEAQGAATLVTETYDVGGHAPGGLDKLAIPVDGVLTEQLARLKSAVETGAAP